VVDPAHYEGREQALVKHTFLERYMRDALPKVGRFGTFAYVDLFAGPWQSRAPDYSDTSFGIALTQMTKTKAALARNGINVRMMAYLVELNNYQELQRAAATFPDIEVKCYPGKAEHHARAIAADIPGPAFRFVVIDPKGLPDPRHFASLIASPRTEVLLNFMFQFANRFLATQLMPRLVEWLSTVAPGPDWQAQVDRLSGAEREEFITNMARQALAKMGNYEIAPAITVDETESDRALYKLIYLSRHDLGLRVFRDAQAIALGVQADQRSKVKAAKREAKTCQPDMFASAGIVDPGERSARVLADGRRDAECLALEIIRKAGTEGVLWKRLWTAVLDAKVVTYKGLGDAVAAWKRERRISIPELIPPARKPKDHHRIYGT
jgi:three-Cys-motif partner protein